MWGAAPSEVRPPLGIERQRRRQSCIVRVQPCQLAAKAAHGMDEFTQCRDVVDQTHRRVGERKQRCRLLKRCRSRLNSSTREKNKSMRAAALNAPWASRWATSGEVMAAAARIT